MKIDWNTNKNCSRKQYSSLNIRQIRTKALFGFFSELRLTFVIPNDRLMHEKYLPMINDEVVSKFDQELRKARSVNIVCDGRTFGAKLLSNWLRIRNIWQILNPLMEYYISIVNEY